MLGLLVLTFDNISAMNRGDEIFPPVVECTREPGENPQTCHKLLTNLNHLMRILNSQLEL